MWGWTKEKKENLFSLETPPPPSPPPTLPTIRMHTLVQRYAHCLCMLTDAWFLEDIEADGQAGQSPSEHTLEEKGVHTKSQRKGW